MLAPRPVRRRTVLLVVALVVAVLLGTLGVAAAQGWPPFEGEDSGPPLAGGYFSLSPVGSYASLPDDKGAAAEVHRSTWEPRRDNETYNGTVPEGLRLVPRDPSTRAYDPRWNTHVLRRVTGDFTGTTDEIFQWAAAKWGVPDDLLRAMAYRESEWRQGNFGDEVDDAAACAEVHSTPPCAVTFGIVGVRSTSWPGIFPWNRDSTAAAVDVLGGWLRGCYEGWVWWLRDHGHAGRGVYRAGDLWGCVGAWFSGDWHDGAVGVPSGENYIHRVKDAYRQRPWLARLF
ncbi:hypothetical protein [Petropleomorpha daqingensis]|uniref:Autotransporter family porin n=1 Tax=Petropleomorpha daqingensis TaxID=2026353 RepID=A0A853CFC5_9ACTN|nr:hypothetical protein [Petropleomorpha daqingensis]NYJ05851.1 autotransporter family porin [Petropleomorpha daqingensis]